MSSTKISYVTAFLVCVLGVAAQAAEPASEIEQPQLEAAATPASDVRRTQWAPQVATIFPTMIGAGFSVTRSQHYGFSLLAGTTPKPYHEAIASVAADIADNGSYEGVINSAFENNFLARAAFQYNFTSPRKGWNIQLGASMLKSKGDATIDEVLAVSTGNDYTNLKNLLIAAGKDPSVDLDSSLVIAELSTGYTWPVSKKMSLSANFGVAKVMSADMEISTGLPNFEKSAQGKKLLSSTESDLETVVEDYGLTPTLGLTLAYLF